MSLIEGNLKRGSSYNELWLLDKTVACRYWMLISRSLWLLATNSSDKKVYLLVYLYFHSDIFQY